MLLETLEKENNIIIYSKNIVDVQKSFRIIYQDAIEPKPVRIDFRKVYKFINDSTPKNIILYRLLTNLANFTLKSTKYGILLYVNDSVEVLFFDPAFAVKELENLVPKINRPKLRFRIQQVGLTSHFKGRSYPNFVEVYRIDLEPGEAQNQNDKVFVKAILMQKQLPRGLSKHREYNPDYKKLYPKPFKLQKVEIDLSKENDFVDEIKAAQQKKLKHTLSEDSRFDHKRVIKIKIDKEVLNEEPAAAVKNNSLYRSKEALLNAQSKLDIFKSSDSLKNYVSSKDKHVLRLEE